MWVLYHILPQCFLCNIALIFSPCCSIPVTAYLCLHIVLYEFSQPWVLRHILELKTPYRSLLITTLPFWFLKLLHPSPHSTFDSSCLLPSIFFIASALHHSATRVFTLYLRTESSSSWSSLIKFLFLTHLVIAFLISSQNGFQHLLHLGSLICWRSPPIACAPDLNLFRVIY